MSAQGNRRRRYRSLATVDLYRPFKKNQIHISGSLVGILCSSGPRRLSSRSSQRQASPTPGFSYSHYFGLGCLCGTKAVKAAFSPPRAVRGDCTVRWRLCAVLTPSGLLLLLCRPAVVEEDLRGLFASSGSTVKAFKFFQ